MAAVRRIYVFVVAGTSLAMFLGGLAGLGSALLDLLFVPGAIGRGARESLAVSGALVLVGLPVWAFHWRWAERMAAQQAGERSATLRRLFLYATLAGLAIALITTGVPLLRLLLGLLLGTVRFDAAALARVAWPAVLLLPFWTYHRWIAGRDRLAAGETGSSATLRRWYIYGFQVVGLLMMLISARTLVESLLISAIRAGTIIWPSAGLIESVVLTFVGLSVWAVHVGEASRLPIAEDDRRSALRTLAGFLVLALCVGMVLLETSRTLYYALARVMGVQEPGGVSGDLPVLLVGPVSTTLVFGAAWFLLRRRLTVDAAGSEALRQAGIRRLYTHLVALIAIGAFASGLAVVLFSLVDSALGRPDPRPGAWQDQLSLGLTLVAVGLPTWLTHWRPAPVAVERLALSRRLYLFGALLAGMLAFLGGAAMLFYRVLALLLDIGAAQSPSGDIARGIAVSLVSAGVAFYHWRALRIDNAQRAELTVPPPPDSHPAPAALTVRIVGASHDDVRRALAGLPPGATYSLAEMGRDV